MFASNFHQGEVHWVIKMTSIKKTKQGQVHYCFSFLGVNKNQNKSDFPLIMYSISLGKKKRFSITYHVVCSGNLPINLIAIPLKI